MDTFAEKIHIPSSDSIAARLGLKFQQQPQPENKEASFGFSVPVITAECPKLLQYFPLSKSALKALKEDLNEQEFFSSLEGKQHCVLICESFIKNDFQTGQSYALNPFKTSPAYIAGYWDKTEDPLMADTLFSCTFLTASPSSYLPEIFDRVPVFLKQDEVEIWLSPDLSFKEKMERFLR